MSEHIDRPDYEQELAALRAERDRLKAENKTQHDKLVAFQIGYAQVYRDEDYQAALARAESAEVSLSRLREQIEGEYEEGDRRNLDSYHEGRQDGIAWVLNLFKELLPSPPDTKETTR